MGGGEATSVINTFLKTFLIFYQFFPIVIERPPFRVPGYSLVQLYSSHFSREHINVSHTFHIPLIDTKSVFDTKSVCAPCCAVMYVAQHFFLRTSLTLNIRSTALQLSTYAQPDQSYSFIVFHSVRNITCHYRYIFYFTDV